MTDRISEALDIMRKLRHELHVPDTDDGLKELGRRLTAFIKYGKVWAGYIRIPYLNKDIHVVLPNNPEMPIRVVLKA